MSVSRDVNQDRLKGLKEGRMRTADGRKVNFRPSAVKG